MVIKDGVNGMGCNMNNMNNKSLATCGFFKEILLKAIGCFGATLFWVYVRIPPKDSFLWAGFEPMTSSIVGRRSTN